MDSRPTKEPVDAWRMTEMLHAEHGKGDPFAAAIRATRMAMLITDPRQPDNPIVFANEAFLRLTGYERDEVIGQNCRFLQGPDTDSAAVDSLRDAIANRTAVSTDILNYKKDGTPFWNALYISPVSNEQDELQFFFASQLDVTDRKKYEHALAADKERFEQAVRDRTMELEAALEAQTMLLHEVDHRVKNNLQMISSLIVMQARSIGDADVKASLMRMLERIEALSTVHRRLYQSDDVTIFSVSDFIRDLVSDLLAASGRDGVKARFELDEVSVRADKATPVALLVNEIVTNALKHAYAEADGSSGQLSVALRGDASRFVIDIADDGPGLPDGAAEGANSFGMRLIRSLTRQLGASIEWHNASPGTRVVVTVPAERPDG